MNELKNQFANALLVILTVAAVAAAYINFQQNFHPDKRFRLPEDGVTWVDRPGVKAAQVIALHVAAGSPAEKAGVRSGDRILKIQGTPIEAGIDVARVLLAVKPWNQAAYDIERRGIEFKAMLSLPKGLRVCHCLSVCNRIGIPWHRLVRLFPPRKCA
ncbi:MAG: PDZ domain-containing protein [Bryobacteraceae bacterium]